MGLWVPQLPTSICNQASNLNEVWLVLASSSANRNAMPCKGLQSHWEASPHPPPFSLGSEWCMTPININVTPKFLGNHPQTQSDAECRPCHANEKGLLVRSEETKPQNYFWLIWQIMRDSEFYGVSSSKAKGIWNPHAVHAPENPIESNRSIRTLHLKWVKLWNWQSVVAGWMDAKKQLLNALKYVSLISRKTVGKIAENGERAVGPGHNLTTCGRYWSTERGAWSMERQLI